MVGHPVTGPIELIDVLFRYDPDSGRGVGPLTLSIEAGEHLGVLGPSGCGKTTLVRIIAGLLPNATVQMLEGVVRNPFTEVGSEAPIGFMFQHPALLPQKTVLENVRFPLLAIPHTVEDEKHADDLLRAVGLADASNLLPEQLSGGMRTRVSMARALLRHPTLLLLDEPFTGLDIETRESAYRTIERLVTDAGATTVLVTHDLEEAWRMCDRVVILDALGKVHAAVEDVAKMDLGMFRETLMRTMVVPP